MLALEELVDNLSKEARSRVMTSIRSRNTGPELLIRRKLWASGKRYRIHDRSVLGIPDISNKRKKVAVFIDGCFWHGCSSCYKEPTSNVKYWKEKIIRNRERRRQVLKDLREYDWTILEFWEHEVRSNPGAVSLSISKKL